MLVNGRGALVKRHSQCLHKVRLVEGNNTAGVRARGGLCNQLNLDNF